MMASTYAHQSNGIGDAKRAEESRGIVSSQTIFGGKVSLLKAEMLILFGSRLKCSKGEYVEKLLHSLKSYEFFKSFIIVVLILEF